MPYSDTYSDTYSDVYWDPYSGLPGATAAVGHLSTSSHARASIFRYPHGSASGLLRFAARALPVVPATRIYPGISGHLSLWGTAFGSISNPYGAFRDFAHYANGALDPAMVLVRAHNGGALSTDGSNPSGYRSYFAVASAPVDYPVSGGAKAWNRAAYASIGLKFKALLNAGSELIQGAQFEVAKYSASAPVPYQKARSLNCVVVPQRVQQCVNPSFEAGTTGWSASAGTLTNPTTGGYIGSRCARVTASGAAQFSLVGASYSEVEGAPFAFSAYVRGTPNRSVAIQIHWSTGAWTNGPIQLIASATDWQRLTYTGVVPDGAGSGTLYISELVSGVSSGDYLETDCALVETSWVIGDYFDGNTGSDYIWGGAPNATMSFYYQDRINRSYLLANLLAENCPLGVTPGVPQFGVVTAPHSAWILGDASLSLLGVSTFL
jgi:hypothetical protein